MGADYLDLAVANALVRLHFDKFGSLEPKVQAHAHAKYLLFLHNNQILSPLKVFERCRSTPAALFLLKKGISVRAETPLDFGL